jgi:hypothetical protein
MRPVLEGLNYRARSARNRIFDFFPKIAFLREFSRKTCFIAQIRNIPHR